MTLNRELERFNNSCVHLHDRITSLSRGSNPSEDDEFLAEAIAFRLFRIQERLVRAFVLESCAKTRSPGNNRIYSKLRCSDWDTAEEILKAGNRFLDWGNPTTIKNLSSLIFDNGFPVTDAINAMYSTLVDLQRIRNFVAHDSKEARANFSKAARNYLRTGANVPQSAGGLLLHRKRASDQMALRILFERIRNLSDVIRNI